MDLASIFTFLVLRCLSIEEDICALSISMRQDALGALGLPDAALAEVEKSKSGIASITAKSVIGHLSIFKFVAMREDGKFHGTLQKVIHREAKNGGGVPTNELRQFGRGSSEIKNGGG